MFSVSTRSSTTILYRLVGGDHSNQTLRYRDNRSSICRDKFVSIFWETMIDYKKKIMEIINLLFRIASRKFGFFIYWFTAEKSFLIFFLHFSFALETLKAEQTIVRGSWCGVSKNSVLFHIFETSSFPSASLFPFC